MLNPIKLNQLIEIAKKNPRDVEFIKTHLSLDNQKIFSEIVKENKRSPRRQSKTHLDKSFKSCVVTVLDEPRLASEFTIAMSKLYTHKSIAILDADRFDPRLHIYLNSKCYIKSVYTHLDFNRTTGLNLLIDALHKHTLTSKYAKHLALSVNGCKNIHYFSGSYMLDDYEYYKLEDYKKILSFLKSNYDLVVISSNKFIYDAFTCHSLMVSDSNLISVSGHMPDIKEKQNYMNFLEKKQKINDRKNIFVVYDYNKTIHVEARLIKEMLNNYVIIPFSKYRSYGVRRHYYLTKHMKRRHISQYLKVFKMIKKVL
jgi:hypothetical protein